MKAIWNARQDPHTRDQESFSQLSCAGGGMVELPGRFLDGTFFSGLRVASHGDPSTAVANYLDALRKRGSPQFVHFTVNDALVPGGGTPGSLAPELVTQLFRTLGLGRRSGPYGSPRNVSCDMCMPDNVRCRGLLCRVAAPLSPSWPLSRAARSATVRMG